MAPVTNGTAATAAAASAPVNGNGNGNDNVNGTAPPYRDIDDDYDDDDTETTPLIQAVPVVIPETDGVTAGRDGQKVNGKSSYGTTTQEEEDGPPPPQPQSQSRRGVDQDDDKPLPMFQIALLCYARVIEPIAFFSIFPYINQMIMDNSDLPETDVGFYSGLIESLFSLTQMCVMMFWGRAADRVGRKPILVSSLLGASFAIALFGFARSLWQMILFRCLAGAFAGTVVTIRTMITEHSTQRTQARSFAWFAFSGNIGGIFLGPLIGGALADPVGQYPSVFKGIVVFEEYPYALASLVVGCIGLTAVLSSALFLEETLPSKVKARQLQEAGHETDETANGAVAAPPSSTAGKETYWELLKAPGVVPVLILYSHIMLLAFAYTAVVPVFWFTSVKYGGLGFSKMQISLFLALGGIAQSLWLILVFPPFQNRAGTNGVLRICAAAYPLSFVLIPILNLILRIGTDEARTAFWVVGPFVIIMTSGLAMSFTAVQLALNDVSPSHQSLGTLNALALTCMSGLRAFTPALFTSIFAFGVRNQILAGHLIWAILVALAGLLSAVTPYLPEVSERPPMERQRDDEE